MVVVCACRALASAFFFSLGAPRDKNAGGRKEREEKPVALWGDTHLVHGDDEGGLAQLEKLDRLDRLLFKAVHQVDDQDCNVAQATAALPEVGEGFVPRGVDDEEAGHLHLERVAAAELLLGLVCVAFVWCVVGFLGGSVSFLSAAAVAAEKTRARPRLPALLSLSLLASLFSPLPSASRSPRPAQTSRRSAA